MEVVHGPSAVALHVDTERGAEPSWWRLSASWDDGQRTLRFGELVDEQPGAARREQCLEAKAPGAALRVVQAHCRAAWRQDGGVSSSSTSSTRVTSFRQWSSNFPHTTTASDAAAIKQDTGPTVTEFGNLQLVVNPLDVSFLRTRASVGRSGSIGSRRPPSRPRRPSALDDDLQPLQRPRSSEDVRDAPDEWQRGARVRRSLPPGGPLLEAAERSWSALEKRDEEEEPTRRRSFAFDFSEAANRSSTEWTDSAHSRVNEMLKKWNFGASPGARLDRDTEPERSVSRTTLLLTPADEEPQPALGELIEDYGRSPVEGLSGTREAPAVSGISVTFSSADCTEGSTRHHSVTHLESGKEALGAKARSSKKVEFSKTEVHFAAESGRFHIVESAGKPPPSSNFRRRRRAEAVSEDGMRFGDSPYEKRLLAGAAEQPLPSGDLGSSRVVEDLEAEEATKALLGKILDLELPSADVRHESSEDSSERPGCARRSNPLPWRAQQKPESCEMSRPTFGGVRLRPSGSHSSLEASPLLSPGQMELQKLLKSLRPVSLESSVDQGAQVANGGGMEVRISSGTNIMAGAPPLSVAQRVREVEERRQKEEMTGQQRVVSSRPSGQFSTRVTLGPVSSSVVSLEPRCLPKKSIPAAFVPSSPKIVAKISASSKISRIQTSQGDGRSDGRASTENRGSPGAGRGRAAPRAGPGPSNRAPVAQETKTSTARPKARGEEKRTPRASRSAEDAILLAELTEAADAILLAVNGYSDGEGEATGGGRRKAGSKKQPSVARPPLPPGGRKGLTKERSEVHTRATQVKSKTGMAPSITLNGEAKKSEAKRSMNIARTLETVMPDSRNKTRRVERKGSEQSRKESSSQVHLRTQQSSPRISLERKKCASSRESDRAARKGMHQCSITSA